MPLNVQQGCQNPFQCSFALPVACLLRTLRASDHVTGLLLLLRIEEDREAAKMQRMRQHVGPAKVKVHVQYAYSQHEEEPETATLPQLTKQLADIQRLLASLTAAQSSLKSMATKPTSSHHSSEGQVVGKSQRNPRSAPKPGYCFRCGENGHITTH